MRANCKHKCGRFAVMAVVGVGLGGLAIMLLWNWLTPGLFGWKEISYLQAIALLALTRMLVGGFHGRCGYGHCHGRMDQMTPEERERVQASMKSKWCGCGSSEKSAEHQ